ncbi:hypothetical protein GNI_034430 [Gregarina niphandrodes]|uniref:Uncharacterized protein n=1 Tax=Gregarina niphandrodes TaxID=110365 RepID=A0A023BAT2_GRENI|nr:hypothetical protein GNI_034430 [Gregarina niphandrodes]EZG78605.1 hypothetical protein GNI_034430 [Gregarina niphandrodes]|eukprot:XP_011129243.1 hypothetical protein GNI_034430 [Gregarina niphandrodes]
MRSLSSVQATTNIPATLSASFLVKLGGREIDLGQLGSVAAGMQYAGSFLFSDDCHTAKLVFDGLKIMASQALDLTVKLPDSKLMNEEDAGIRGEGSQTKSSHQFYTQLAEQVFRCPYLQEELAGVIRDFVTALETVNIETWNTKKDAAEHRARVEWQRRCGNLDGMLDFNAIYTRFSYCLDGVHTLEALAAAYNQEYTTQFPWSKNAWRFPSYRIRPEEPKEEEHPDVCQSHDPRMRAF